MANRKRPARVLASKRVFHGPIFNVFSETVREPTGITARRDIIRHPGSIVVIALDGENVLLERQYRWAAGRELWEFPAGRIDPGERPLAAAKRELLEETGYTARQWKRLTKFYVSPGFLDETMEIFVARGLRAGEAQPEDDESIAVRFFPMRTALQMVRRGQIIDAKTIAGLLWLAQFRKS